MISFSLQESCHQYHQLISNSVILFLTEGPLWHHPLDKPNPSTMSTSMTQSQILSPPAPQPTPMVSARPNSGTTSPNPIPLTARFPVIYLTIEKRNSSPRVYNIPIESIDTWEASLVQASSALHDDKLKYLGHRSSFRFYYTFVLQKPAPFLSPPTAQVVIRAISSRARGRTAYLREENFYCSWEAVSRIRNVQCVSS